MKEKPQTLSEVRKQELKRIEKRLKELLEYRNDRNPDGSYKEYNEYRGLPTIVRKSIDNEIDALNIKRRQLQFDQETIKNDLRLAFMNVLKYYGVDDKLPEIEEKFNRYKDENSRFESMLQDLSIAIDDKVSWEKYRRDYMY